MVFRVDLNSDIGEGFGNYVLGMDEEILNYVTSINLACGWHAGDANIMDKTVAMAKEKGVYVGAHPGYPDLLGFGRRAMAIKREEAKNYMLYQTGALMESGKCVSSFPSKISSHTSSIFCARSSSNTPSFTLTPAAAFLIRARA